MGHASRVEVLTERLNPSALVLSFAARNRCFTIAVWARSSTLAEAAGSNTGRDQCIASTLTLGTSHLDVQFRFHGISSDKWIKGP